ncbi:helix-turn-helix domain-containing protein [Micromonospora echinospora]|uniref:helix-turn-helix domain-containing protein n=1 Tax=Micromonospora echinospora TaxID=1877 RepID=UPI00378D3997
MIRRLLAVLAAATVAGAAATLALTAAARTWGDPAAALLLALTAVWLGQAIPPLIRTNHRPRTTRSTTMATSYADPDIRTTPAGSYRHPRHYATVTPGPPALPSDSELLRRWRRSSHLTQTDVAAAVGCRPRQISRYERGIDPIPVGLLARLGIAARAYQP